MPGLTFSVALFFLLVMIPGYVGLWASGRIDEARQKFYPALYRGIMNFGIVLFWSFLLSERFPFAGRFEICQTVGNYLASGLSALFATFSGRYTGNYTGKHGYSPTIRELSKITGAGVATVHKHLNELIYGGYIRIEQPRRRVIRVVKDYD